MYPDEYIDFWGELFTANHLFARGIVFETFLQAPLEILHAVKFGTPFPLLESEFYPLLPAQYEVQVRQFRKDLEAELAEMDGRVVALRDGALVQSLRHFDAPKKWKTHGRAWA